MENPGLIPKLEYLIQSFSEVTKKQIVAFEEYVDADFAWLKDLESSLGDRRKFLSVIEFRRTLATKKCNIAIPLKEFEYCNSLSLRNIDIENSYVTPLNRNKVRIKSSKAHAVPYNSTKSTRKSISMQEAHIPGKVFVRIKKLDRNLSSKPQAAEIGMKEKDESKESDESSVPTIVKVNDQKNSIESTLKTQNQDIQNDNLNEVNVSDKFNEVAEFEEKTELDISKQSTTSKEASISIPSSDNNSVVFDSVENNIAENNEDHKFLMHTSSCESSLQMKQTQFDSDEKSEPNTHIRKFTGDEKIFDSNVVFEDEKDVETEKDCGIIESTFNELKDNEDLKQDQVQTIENKTYKKNFKKRKISENINESIDGDESSGANKNENDRITADISNLSLCDPNVEEAQDVNESKSFKKRKLRDRNEKDTSLNKKDDYLNSKSNDNLRPIDLTENKPKRGRPRKNPIEKMSSQDKGMVSSEFSSKSDIVCAESFGIDSNTDSSGKNDVEKCKGTKCRSTRTRTRSTRRSKKELKIKKQTSNKKELSKIKDNINQLKEDSLNKEDTRINEISTDDVDIIKSSIDILAVEEVPHKMRDESIKCDAKEVTGNTKKDSSVFVLEDSEQIVKNTTQKSQVGNHDSKSLELKESEADCTLSNDALQAISTLEGKDGNELKDKAKYLIHSNSDSAIDSENLLSHEINHLTSDRLDTSISTISGLKNGIIGGEKSKSQEILQSNAKDEDSVHKIEKSVPLNVRDRLDSKEHGCNSTESDDCKANLKISQSRSTLLKRDYFTSEVKISKPDKSNESSQDNMERELNVEDLDICISSDQKLLKNVSILSIADQSKIDPSPDDSKKIPSPRPRFKDQDNFQYSTKGYLVKESNPFSKFLSHLLKSDCNTKRSDFPKEGKDCAHTPYKLDNTPLKASSLLEVAESPLWIPKKPMNDLPEAVSEDRQNEKNCSSTKVKSNGSMEVSSGSIHPSPQHSCRDTESHYSTFDNDQNISNENSIFQSLSKSNVNKNNDNHLEFPKKGSEIVRDYNFNDNNPCKISVSSTTSNKINNNKSNNDDLCVNNVINNYSDNIDSNSVSTNNDCNKTNNSINDNINRCLNYNKNTVNNNNNNYFNKSMAKDNSIIKKTTPADNNDIYNKDGLRGSSRVKNDHRLLNKTFSQSPEFQYKIFEYDSDDEKDAEGPSWTRKENLYPALLAQSKIDPDEIFVDFAKTCDLAKIFTELSNGVKKVRPRTSSANWNRDKLNVREDLEYKKCMKYESGAGAFLIKSSEINLNK